MINIFDGKYEEAIKSLEKGMEKSPGSVTGLNNIIVCNMYVMIYIGC